MSKNVVVCIDGTWNSAETQNTNIVRLHGMVDPDKCVRFYRKGPGAGVRLLSKLLDGASGNTTFGIARDALFFVQGNFRRGDRLFIFGFSRGAFAARHLAAMISRYGLGQHFEDTFRRYHNDVVNGLAPEVAEQVHFLGLFDCVNANQLYMLRRGRRNFNSPLLESGIQHFAHGVSRDERRWSFAPIFFQPNGQQTFNQVWMPGYHFDVGGCDNAPLNGFALWWMLREAYGCGLPLEHIKCPVDNPRWHHGRLGGKIGFVPDIDSTAPGRCSDWPTTRYLKLRSPRPGRAGSERVQPMPQLEDLDVCPRGCGEEMFNYLATAEGERRFGEMRRRMTSQD